MHPTAPITPSSDPSPRNAAETREPRMRDAGEASEPNANGASASHIDTVHGPDAGADGTADSTRGSGQSDRWQAGRQAGRQAGWQHLPERVKRVWLINASIAWIALLAVSGLFAAVATSRGWWNAWTIAADVATALLAVLAIPTLPWRIRHAYIFTRFRIGERDVRIAKGWLFRSTVTVPYNRVQHIDTNQGPVLRMFGLTGVKVSTAVGEHEIEALDSAEAQRIVERITASVMAAKEDL